MWGLVDFVMHWCYNIDIGWEILGFPFFYKSLRGDKDMIKKLKMDMVMDEVRSGVYNPSSIIKSLEEDLNSKVGDEVPERELLFPSGSDKISEMEDWYGVGVYYWKPYAKVPSKLAVVNLPNDKNLVEGVEKKIQEYFKSRLGISVDTWNMRHNWDGVYAS